MNIKYFKLSILFLLLIDIVATEIDVDPLGYIVYCPCMGKY